MPKAVSKKKKSGSPARTAKGRSAVKAPAKPAAAPVPSLPAQASPSGPWWARMEQGLLIRLILAAVVLCVFAFMHWHSAAPAAP
jgi:hypothetical protein